MTARISTWGNSQGVRLPKNIIQDMSLAVGDKVNIFIEDHKLIIEPLKDIEYDINELVAQMPDSYSVSEEIDDVVGNEVW